MAISKETRAAIIAESSDFTYAELAERHGCSRSSVQRIVPNVTPVENPMRWHAERKRKVFEKLRARALHAQRSCCNEPARPPFQKFLINARTTHFQP